MFSNTIRTKKVIRSTTAGKGLVKPKPGQLKITSTDVASSKLIAALEAEERRLRDNEFRYAERIKSLTTQLELERGSSKKAQDLVQQLGQVRKKYDDICNKFNSLDAEKSNLHFKYQDLVKYKTEAEGKIAKLTETTALLSQDAELLQKERERNNILSGELERVNTRADELHNTLTRTQTVMTQIEQDKSKFAARLLKEREQWNIKITEV